MNLALVAFVISVANTAFVAVSAFLLWNQIRREHNWNRRKAAHDLLFLASNDLRQLRDRLESKVDIWDDSQTYSNLKERLTKEDQRALDAILNYLENICLAVHNGVVDEKLIYDTLSGVVIAYRRWAGPYIKEQRGKNNLFWIGIEPYADSWQRKDRDMVHKAAGEKRVPA